MAWCHSLVLRTCQRQKQTENPGRYTMDEHSFDEKPSTLYLNQNKEPPKRLLLLGFKWLEKAWHRIRGGKGWLKYLIPLIMVGLMLGLVMILHSVEKKSHLPHRDKDHHEHNDD